MVGFYGHEVSISYAGAKLPKIDLASPCEGLASEVNSDLERIDSTIRGSTGMMLAEIASQSRSLQISALGSYGSIKSGRLAGSITEEVDGNTAKIGTDLFYAEFVNDGRGSVTAGGKALHFFIDGVEVFVKSVAPSSPRPYVDTSAGILETRLDSIVGRYLESIV